VSWDPDIRTVYINTNSKPSGKKEGTKIVAGFEVPLDTNLAAVEEEWVERQRLVFKLTYCAQM